MNVYHINLSIFLNKLTNQIILFIIYDLIFLENYPPILLEVMFRYISIIFVKNELIYCILHFNQLIQRVYYLIVKL